MVFKQVAYEERFEILLAMAIAFDRQKNAEPIEGDELPPRSTADKVLEILSALDNEDLTILREKVGFYEALTDEEKQLWQARVLSRVKNRSLRLDKDVHYTHIAELLRSEPDYICNFILRNLSAEMRQNIALRLDVPIENSEAAKNLNQGVEQLLRRRFLTNFVAREDLYELKPLDMLSGDDLLKFLQDLGRDEIAFVCRGIGQIENLAPFLRQFAAADAQAIVEQMAKLRTVERKRIEKAETLVKEAWQSESDPTLVVQLIGLKKLAAAFFNIDNLKMRYTLQKLPIKLADQLRQLLADDSIEQSFVETVRSEVETVAARILLEKMQEKRLAKEHAVL